MSTLSRRTFSLSAMGLLSGGLLAACGTESEGEEPMVTRVTAPGAPPTITPLPPEAPPVGTPPSSASTPVAPSDDAPLPPGGGEASPPAVTGVESVPTTVSITYVDFAFEPADITVAAGQDVTLNFQNAGAAQHAYKVDNPLIESRTINGGETDSITINVPAGTYESYCPVPGHKELGMVGKLIAQ